MKIISGFEPTRIITKEHGLDKVRDVLSNTRHYSRSHEDLGLVKEHGISMLRVAVPWHRIEVFRGKYHWDWMDLYMQDLKFLGIEPILDPLHHVSIPSWLKGGFLDEDFVETYLDFFHELTNRYYWVNKYTIVNEPLVTTYFATHEGIWYPFATGKDNFEKGLDNIFRIIQYCSSLLEDTGRQHWYVDSCENHEGTCDASHAFAEKMNKHRFQLLDRLVAEDVHIDMLGLDYYPHCEFKWGSECRIDTDNPIGFAEIAKIYRERYNLPLALTETNIRGFVEDRQTWFKHMYKECEKAGIDIMCWYPFIDSMDWDSLVTQSNSNVDPQGILWINKENDYERVRNEFSENIKKLNKGEISIDDVKEYPYQPPLDNQLKGFV